MLKVLELEFGVSENALQLIKSLSDRKQFACVNQVDSKSFDVSHAVPQGGCLGPVLFLFYVSKLCEIINKHLPNSHGCADDSQLDLSFRPESSNCQDEAVKCVEDCTADIGAWLISQKLSFNDFKTKFMVIGPFNN